MKAIIKKIDFKLLIIITSLLLFEAIVFFLTKPFIQQPYILGSFIDNLIPFIPYFVWIYVFWYFMLIFVPYYIAQKNISSFYKYAVSFIITTIISGGIFVIFPNGVIRADVQGIDISSRIVKIIYLLDTPAINCLPSVHCLFSYLFIFAIFDTKEHSPIAIKVIITILSILVVLSTLFIKQHVIFDAIASLIIASATWFLINMFKKYNILQHLVKKILSI